LKRFFIYDFKPLDSGNLFYGCLCVLFNGTNQVHDMRYIFQEVEPSKQITDFWNWFSVDKIEFFHILDNKLNEGVFEDLKIEFLENFGSEFNTLNNKKSLPKFVFISKKDIEEKFKNFPVTNKKELDKFITIYETMILIKIASFFNENEFLIFNFPLFKDFLVENNLSENDYSVEDYIQFITNILTIQMKELL
jgi:hypothetical protein